MFLIYSKYSFLPPHAQKGYRTIVDSNEMPKNDQPANNDAIDQFEQSERLAKFRALERQQLEQQKELLNKQIRLQEQIQEKEIREQNNELDENINRDNYEQKVDEVYVAPLPQNDWEIQRQNVNRQRQREEHSRASKQWILNQTKHFEEQQIARKKADEKKRARRYD